MAPVLGRFRVGSVGTRMADGPPQAERASRVVSGGGRLLAVGSARHRGILRGVRVREDGMSSLFP